MLYKLQQRYLSSTFARSLTSTSVSTGLLEIVSSCSALQFTIVPIWSHVGAGILCLLFYYCLSCLYSLVLALNTTLFENNSFKIILMVRRLVIG